MIDREKVYLSTCDCYRLGARSFIKSSHEYLVRILNAHTPEYRKVLWDELINSGKLKYVPLPRNGGGAGVRLRRSSDDA